MKPLVFMCVNVDFNINYICYKETKICTDTHFIY